MIVEPRTTHASRRRRMAHIALTALVLVGAVQVELLMSPGGVTVAAAAGPSPTFATPLNYANGSTTLSDVVLSADTRGGSNVVSGNGTAASVSFLPANRNGAGTPDGTFGTAVVSSSGAQATAIAAGDLNNDGIPDLVVATFNNTFNVMMGQPGETYGPLTTLQTIPPYNVGSQQVAFARIADLNGDGKLDVVLALNTGCVCSAETAVWVALGNGDGTFQAGAEVNFPEAGLGSNPGVTGLALIDVNSDARPDIVLALGDTGHGFDDGQVWVSINQGAGTFPQGTLAVDNHGIRSNGPGEAMASADFNKDGKPDIATIQTPLTEGQRGVDVYLNQGGSYSTGTYIADPALTDGTNALGTVRSVATADVNGDGWSDIVTASTSNAQGNGVSIYLNNQNGTFATPVFIATAGFEPDSLAIGDLNNDGKPDLVLGSQAGGSNVHVMLNTTPTAPVGGNVTDAETKGGGNLCWPCLAARLDKARNRGRFPISLPFGTFWHTFADMFVDARGYPLAVSQTYNSSDAAVDRGLGFGWSSNLFATLVVSGTSPNQSVTVTAENGSQVVFNQSGTAWAAAPRVQATLVLNPDGMWTFTRGGADVLTFNASGQILSERDLNGNVLNDTYTAGVLTSISHDDIAHSDTRSLALTWSGGSPNHILSVVDNNAGLNRKAAFTYDAGGQLTDIDWTTGGLAATDVNEHFEYETATPLSHRITGMRDPRGFWVTQAYDTSGRVTSQTEDPTAKNPTGLNRVTSYDYSVANQVTVTDPRGNRSTDTYMFGELQTRTLGVGTPQAATWRYAYDPSTLGPTSITDPNNHSTGTTYDSYGNATDVVDALGHHTSSQFGPGDAPYHQPTSVTDALGVTTTFTYDARRNLASAATPLVGSSPLQTRTTTYFRDDANHPGDVSRLIDPNGRTWQYGYDANGDSASATDPLGDQSTAFFNADGWKTSSVSPKGNVAGCSCAAQYTTTYSYADPVNAQVGNFGDVRVVTDPLAHTSTYTYDAARNVVSLKDGDGNVTSYTYDAAGAVTKVTRPDTTTLLTDYWPDGTVKDQVDGAGHTTSYAYDPLARVTGVTDPLNRTTSATYDGAGNRLTVVDASNLTTTYGYDAANRMTSITYSDGHTPNVGSLTYDADNQRTAMTDGTGTSSWVWDSLHRMTSSTNGAGQSVAYGYDLNGQMTSLTYPGAHVVQRVYDNAGRLASVSDWLGHTTTYTPDANANVAAEIYPNTTTATFSYDHADRVSAISDAPTATPNSPFASFSYTRDGNGQVSGVTSTGVPADNHSYSYTSLNQLKTVGTQQLSYSTADTVTQLNDGRTMAYDAADQLTSSVAQPISVVGSVSGGNNKGGTVTLTLPAGIAANDQIFVAATQQPGKTLTTPTGYTQVASVTSSGTPGAWTVVWRKTAVGGETSVAIAYAGRTPMSDVAVVYRGVDASAPIDVQTTATGAGVASLAIPSVTTTVAGDRLVVFGGASGNAAAASWTAPTGMTLQAQVNTLASTASGVFDQTLAAAGATGTRTEALSATAQLTGVMLALKPLFTTYGYDARGNRTTVTPPGGTTTTLTYDQVNRLTAYGASATYAYNGDGLRSSKTVSGTAESFTWDVAEGLPKLLVDSTASSTTYYIYGDGGVPIEQITSAGVVDYYHQDQLGTTRALTDSAGAVAATFTYDAYGKLLARTGTLTTPFGYAGEYTDSESGLQYLRARYYDPTTAQFVSRDPLVASTREPYAYVQGSPLNKTDPLGLFEFGGLAAALEQIGAGVGEVGADVGGLAIGIAALPATALAVTGTILFNTVTAGGDLTDADYQRVYSAITACHASNPWGYVPPPSVLPAFKGTRWATPKTPFPGGLRRRWKDQDGNIYEWDYQHGRVEKYDRTGRRHFGDFDPNTGEQIGRADPTRTVER
jgi:RHS repeat-associated protein